MGCFRRMAARRDRLGRGGRAVGGGASSLRRVRAACADDWRLLRDPGGELEFAGGLHGAILTRATCFLGGRRLRVGIADLSSEDAADRQHAGGCLDRRTWGLSA